MSHLEDKICSTEMNESLLARTFLKNNTKESFCYLFPLIILQAIWEIFKYESFHAFLKNLIEKNFSCKFCTDKVLHQHESFHAFSIENLL